MSGQPDRQTVSLEFKLSKNYNSFGAAVGFSSDRKDGETDEEFFQRVLNHVDREFDVLYKKADKLLG